jgi:hypothetical protein
VSISKIVTLIHENENTFIDKKDFLMCGSCFWCVSCLTENRTIVLCPSCGNNEMQLMPISDYESYKLDHDYINEMVSECGQSKVVIV